MLYIKFKNSQEKNHNIMILVANVAGCGRKVFVTFQGSKSVDKIWSSQTNIRVKKELCGKIEVTN